MVTEAEWKLAGEVEPTVALTPIPQQDPAVARLKDIGAGMLRYAEQTEVTDLASERRVTNDITLIRQYVKDAKAWHKRFKAPILEEGRKVDRILVEITESFEQADSINTKKLVAYHQAEEAKRREAEAINAVVGEAVVDVPDEQKRVRSEMGTVTFVPQADKEKIQAAVDAGVREIPGVAIYPVWQFKVLDIKQVPEEYRKMGTRATR